VPKAISFYRRALKLAPDDVTRRSKLIDLLVHHGQLPEALAQFVTLREALERAGKMQKAIDKYAEGLRLAQRAGVVGDAVSSLRGHIAEAYVKAQDWPRALNAFVEIGKNNPDEHTRFRLADLYLRVGRASEGEAELDALLARYADSPNKTRAVLEAFAREWPHEVWVNLRLARALAGM